MKLFLSCFFLQLCQGGNVPRQGRIITFPQSEDDTLDVLQSSPSVLARQNTPETSALIKQSRAEEFVVGEIFEPPAGQRCAGRNYQDRRCCTPEEPCGLGEGDCDGPLDGGPNDGHEGCQGELVCGSNICRKFGAYYHPKVATMILKTSRKLLTVAIWLTWTVMDDFHGRLSWKTFMDDFH